MNKCSNTGISCFSFFFSTPPHTLRVVRRLGALSLSPCLFLYLVLTKYFHVKLASRNWKQATLCTGGEAVIRSDMSNRTANWLLLTYSCIYLPGREVKCDHTLTALPLRLVFANTHTDMVISTRPTYKLECSLETIKETGLNMGQKKLSLCLNSLGFWEKREDGNPKAQ